MTINYYLIIQSHTWSHKSQNRRIRDEHIYVYRSRGDNLEKTYRGSDSGNREVDCKSRILIFERQKVCKWFVTKLVTYLYYITHTKVVSCERATVPMERIDRTGNRIHGWQCAILHVYCISVAFKTFFPAKFRMI